MSPLGPVGPGSSKESTLSCRPPSPGLPWAAGEPQSRAESSGVAGTEDTVFSVTLSTATLASSAFSLSVSSGTLLQLRQPEKAVGLTGIRLMLLPDHVGSRKPGEPSSQVTPECPGQHLHSRAVTVLYITLYMGRTTVL